MTISLKNKESSVDIDLKAIAGRLLSMPIISCERIGGGLNSRVYQLEAKNASKYILKFYYRDHSDQRDRLTAEFSSLTFLWQNGVRLIPRPIAMAQDEGCAIYEFIEGEKILPGGITSQDIECVIEFLKELKNLRNHRGIFPPSSEAFFSAQDINANIQMRVNRLKEIEETGEEYHALQNYLENDFVPFWETLIEWVKKNFLESGVSFTESISENEKTLSPSDFGFHNALRDKRGRVIFLDFEYFGWDDPAKTISDFLLHPAMMLEESLKQQLVTGVLKLFKECEPLKHRVKILYPIFGLKWCLIFLNEFIPGDFRRRNFAQMEAINKRSIYQHQLLKAKNMLNAMKQTYREFPYDTSS